MIRKEQRKRGCIRNLFSYLFPLCFSFQRFFRFTYDARDEPYQYSQHAHTRAHVHT